MTIPPIQLTDTQRVVVGIHKIDEPVTESTETLSCQLPIIINSKDDVPSHVLFGSWSLTILFIYSINLRP